MAGCDVRRCLRAIEQVETGGDKTVWDRCDIDTDGTGQRSCGGYQIKEAYFKDALEYGELNNKPLPKKDWQKCAKDRDCAEACVKNYIARYGPLVTGRSGANIDNMSVNEIARLHNGGCGGGYNSQKAKDYAEKVQRAYN